MNYTELFRKFGARETARGAIIGGGAYATAFSPRACRCETFWSRAWAT